MKSRIKEQGSALHIVVIVILIVAVLGLLGFVFWQNFINKPATTTDNTTSISSTTQESSANSKTLSVTEWGVESSYDSDTTIGYELNQFGSLSMTDSSLKTECEKLGSVSRGTANDDAIVGSTNSGKTTKEAYDLGYGDARAQVGSYYYLYTGPQASCGDDTVSRDKAVDAVKEFVANLKES